ncbi:hypothetical protein ASG17_03660 [Brevundimonas sp. Leaf363]|uniref:hypothetical protein n=1 Tax=Brevundimonas sp. Leaf363 TaxID=1736353 RepID=UPI0006F2B158|nr:hypothetical protein [Brevundimonas sp. Leaf363]KQS55201.1 hypothetical protein ASG17_03660 [Brevundimonas sp. Leaf363]
MGDVHSLAPLCVNALQLEAIRQQLSDVTDRLSDEQILCLADSLHEQLRARRLVRVHANKRMERRLCSSGGEAFPF